MKEVLQCLVLLSLASMISSCSSLPPGESLIRQKIPIEIQSGKPVTIIIHKSSPGGASEVGVRCSPEVWSILTNTTQSISIDLISSRWKKVRIERCSLGNDPLGPITGFHDLFYLRGNYGPFTRATVQITFPNAPPGVTRAEILVCGTPWDNL